MHCYVFLSNEPLLTWCHYNTLNGSGLTVLTCSKVPCFWMVEHQLVASTISCFDINMKGNVTHDTWNLIINNTCEYYFIGKQFRRILRGSTIWCKGPGYFSYQCDESLKAKVRWMQSIFSSKSMCECITAYVHIEYQRWQIF